MSRVTQILSRIESGDPAAAQQLLPLVYDELRQLAAARLAKELPGQTLSATALVHEAYLRLVGGPGVGSQESGVGRRTGHASPTPDSRSPTPTFDNRGHFFAAAAEAIRRILVEEARRKGRVKHGGGRQRIDLDAAASLAGPPPDEFLDLDEALTRFTALEPAKAEFVKLRYFAGLSIDEAADLVGISRTTAKRYWTYARAWLLAELSDLADATNS